MAILTVGTDLSPAVGAFLIVYVYEKPANGSILPGWISKALPICRHTVLLVLSSDVGIAVYRDPKQRLGNTIQVVPTKPLSKKLRIDF